MTYDRKIHLRLLYSILFFILGLGSLLIGIIQYNAKGIDHPGVVYLIVSGGFIIIAGGIAIINNRKNLKNQTALKRTMIEEQDERHLFINYKAGFLSMAITIICLFLSTIYFAFVDIDVLFIILSIITVLVLIYITSYLILKKFY